LKQTNIQARVIITEWETAIPGFSSDFNQICRERF